MDVMPPIPVGSETFDEIRTHGMLYVDKTGLLVELCDNLLNGMRRVHVYTRPTRFGKTLNQTMIDRYFNIRYREKENIFKGLNISNHPEFEKLMCEYPVIRLDMRVVSAENMDSIYDGLHMVFKNAYLDFRTAHGDSWMSDDMRCMFSRFISGEINHTEIKTSIQAFSKCIFDELKDKHGNLVNKKPIILIDEYDSFLQDMDPLPVKEYNSISRALANFMTITLKTNENYSLGIVTGILTLSQTGMISGLNTPVIHNVFDMKSGEFFGYTEKEVEKLINLYVPEHVDKKRILADLKSMYDGYIFGDIEIYNPRSVNMYLANGMFDEPPGEYWERMRGNMFLNNLLLNSPESVQNEIAALALDHGKSERVSIDPATIYQDLHYNPSSRTSLYSCLVVTGYLKARPVSKYNNQTTVICDVSLPSKEVEHAYEELIRTVRSRKTKGNRFVDSLLRLDSMGATEAFNERLKGLSTRDSWDHDRCKINLMDFFRNLGFIAETETPLGNGNIDLFVKGDEDMHIPNIYVEITTSNEVGTMDFDKMLEHCWMKFDGRRYVDEDRNGLFVALAWDRRFCRMEIKHYSEIRD